LLNWTPNLEKISPTLVNGSGISEKISPNLVNGSGILEKISLNSLKFKPMPGKNHLPEPGRILLPGDISLLHLDGIPMINDN